MAMNNLGNTNLIQTYEFAHTYNKYVAMYKIDNLHEFEHELTSCDYRFIFLERMQFGNQLFDSLLLEGEDCLKWCKQATKLIGILKQDTVFLLDDIFERIYVAYTKHAGYISVNVFRENSDGRHSMSQMRYTSKTAV